MSNYEKLKPIILEEMEKIYNIFTTIRIIETPDGKHEVTQGVWLDPSAELYYNKLYEILELFQRYEKPSLYK